VQREISFQNAIKIFQLRRQRMITTGLHVFNVSTRLLAYDARPTELWHTLEQTAERVLHTQQCVRRTMKMFGT